VDDNAGDSSKEADQVWCVDKVLIFRYS
jgi:hypothetical protein